jgi:calcyclin binding protein
MDKEKDPMSGIMDLMKVSAPPPPSHAWLTSRNFYDHYVTCYMHSCVQNMYEEGDEDMKRTIAKAWTDARSGKTTDSLSGLC